MPTIAQAITAAAQTLRDADVSDERRTASLLMGQALGLDRTQLLIQANEAVEETSYQSFIEMVGRRAAGEPLQYITGHQEFYGLDFLVTPDVLIPRPETEFLVERVIRLAQEIPPYIHRISDDTSLVFDNVVIVDVGTGSGCIAVTLAHHLKSSDVIATDISRAALDVAEKNAARHGVEGRIAFLEGDLLAPLESFRFANFEGQIDVIASNPPYISPLDKPALQREVRDWEPHSALFGDEEGLSFYRRLLAEGRRFVKPGGYLVCEIGYGQLEAITRMIEAQYWQLEDVTDDLQGIPRVLAIRRRSSA